MRDLLAFDMVPGPDFVEALRAAWDGGDAVLPLDPKAPRAHTDSVLAAMRPAAIVTADGERHRLDGALPVEDGDAVVVATSGSTGAPKGAVHTHESVEYAAFSTSVAAGVTADATWLACLPLSHVGGLSVITRALHTNAGLIVHDGLDPAGVDAAARGGATHVSLVPTALRRVDASLWHTILLGGSAIPADRPINSIATYGMTETFGGVVYDGLALNGVEMRIATDGPTPLGTTGLIELRSPTLLRSYRDGTDPVDRQGWYRTGDVGAIDPVSGLLSVHGRADDLIISGGEKVWPGPVEDVLLGDPRVREVAVIGRLDEEWGQRVVAYVVPSDASTPPTLEDLRFLVREHLPVAAAPKEMKLVDSLPRTALGKIRRTVLDVAHPPTDGHHPRDDHAERRNDV